MASPYIDLRTSGHHVPSLHPHRPIHDQRSSCLQPCHHSPLRIPAKLPESLPLGVAQMPDRIPGSLHRPSTESLLDVAWSPDRTNDPNTDPWSARSAAPCACTVTPAATWLGHPHTSAPVTTTILRDSTRPWRLARTVSGAWSLACNASETCNAYPHTCSIERPGCA